MYLLFTYLLGMEGIIIASEDFKFHTLFYLIAGTFFIAYQTAMRNLGYGTVGIWIGMTAYQWFRWLVFSLRVNRKLLRKMK
jgi:uncharacterized membrane protein